MFQERIAYQQGRRAYEAGYEQGSNPHPPGLLHQAWHEGWREAWVKELKGDEG